jgi:hypothetical protein
MQNDRSEICPHRNKGGRPYLGDRPMTAAERKRRYNESLKHEWKQKGGASGQRQKKSGRSSRRSD